MISKRPLQVSGTSRCVNSPVVEEAARWFADQNPAPEQPVPALRQRFELTALEACEALALARNYRLVRGAFG